MSRSSYDGRWNTGSSGGRDTRKQARVRLMAEQYLAGRGEDFIAGFDEVRFDVVGVLLLGADRPGVRHVEDAF